MALKWPMALEEENDERDRDDDGAENELEEPEVLERLRGRVTLFTEGKWDSDAS